ncbi:hypothetical protein OPT61_g1120 [Boeremia exigua]|uniref:Uncharacterized protein n=1 Tax=Boeremia exigua TaxID=749465 RepID=A0ACC2IRG9_9PLEO|nr:hypothetical protein OPT61_g1120 [Boeremia exigua]
MAYSTSACVGVTVTSLLFTWLTTCLRGYVRLFVTRFPGPDDLFSLFALILFTTQSVIYLVALLNYDVAHHSVSATTAGTTSTGVKMFLICEILFVLSSGLIKVSFTLTLLRIVTTRWQRIGLYILVAITGIVTIITFAILLTTCKPIQYFWMQFTTSPVQGSCHGIAMQVKFSHAHGAIMLFIDLTLGLVVPVYLLSSLQMPWRVKISAGLLLSMGSFASVATIIRIYYSNKADLNGFLYTTNIPFFWGAMEVAASLACTSLTTLKPLIARGNYSQQSVTFVQDFDHELQDVSQPEKVGSNIARKGIGNGKPGVRRNSSTEEIMWVGNESDSRFWLNARL